MSNSYTRVDEEKVKRILDLHKRGHPPARIAQLLGVHRSTVYRKLKAIRSNAGAAVFKRLHERQRDRRRYKRKIDSDVELSSTVRILALRGWLAEDIVAYVEKEFRKKISKPTVERFLERYRDDLLVGGLLDLIEFLFYGFCCALGFMQPEPAIALAVILVFAIAGCTLLIITLYGRKRLRVRTQKALLKSLQNGWRVWNEPKRRPKRLGDKLVINRLSNAWYFVLATMARGWRLGDTKSGLKEYFGLNVSLRRLDEIRDQLKEEFGLLCIFGGILLACLGSSAAYATTQLLGFAIVWPAFACCTYLLGFFSVGVLFTSQVMIRVEKRMRSSFRFHLLGLVVVFMLLYMTCHVWNINNFDYAMISTLICSFLGHCIMDSYHSRLVSKLRLDAIVTLGARGI